MIQQRKSDGSNDVRARRPCGIRADALSDVDRVFGRTTWPCRALCVGLTIFFQISTNELAARLRGLPKHVPERSVS
jgi:hypothetical protein